MFALATRAQRYHQEPEIATRVFELKTEVKKLAGEIRQMADPVPVEIQLRGRWPGSVEGDLEGWRGLVGMMAALTLAEPECAGFSLVATGQAGRVRFRLGRYDFTAHFRPLERPPKARTFLDLAGRKVLYIAQGVASKLLELRFGAARMLPSAAASAEEAVNRLKQERFDLLLVDQSLDVSQIREQWPSTPVGELFSASRQTGFEDRILRALNRKGSRRLPSGR